MAFCIARTQEKGIYFGRTLVTWELQWLKRAEIDEGNKECSGKTQSWFNDEGVLLAARKWISGAGDALTAYGLAKAVGAYCDTGFSALQGR